MQRIRFRPSPSGGVRTAGSPLFRHGLVLVGNGSSYIATGPIPLGRVSHGFYFRSIIGRMTFFVA